MKAKVRAGGTNANGNTVGRVVGETGSAPVPASQANPPVKPETAAEGSVGTKVLDGLQIGLDVVGLIPGVGEIADLANAGISAARGDFVGAGLSLASAVPFAGWGATAAKGVRRGTQIAARTGAEAGAKAAKEGVSEAVEQGAKHGDEAAAAGGRGGKDGGKVKSKKKMKCGEYGRYGDLKKKTGEGKFDRDHIPSKAALKARAAELKGGPLTKAEMSAIDSAADAIAIPRQAHIDVSPTYGQTAADAARDAQNLAGSARRDVEAMLRKIDEYDADGGCKKAYQKAAKRVLKKNNEDFDRWLAETLESAGK